MKIHVPSASNPHNRLFFIEDSSFVTARDSFRHMIRFDAQFVSARMFRSVSFLKHHIIYQHKYIGISKQSEELHLVSFVSLVAFRLVMVIVVAMVWSIQSG